MNIKHFFEDIEKFSGDIKNEKIKDEDIKNEYNQTQVKGDIFKTIKKLYADLREIERENLSDYLKNSLKEKHPEIRVVNRGKAGKGDKEYTSDHKIHPFDLRNWKWVEIKSENMSAEQEDKRKYFDFTVSLNMPDTDSNSGNNHALYDRIGFFVDYRVGTYYYSTAIHTDIELPLDDTKMKKIEEHIRDQYERYKCILKSE